MDDLKPQTDGLTERVENQKNLQKLITKKAELTDKKNEIKHKQALLDMDLYPINTELVAVNFKIQQLRSAIEIGKDQYFSNKP